MFLQPERTDLAFDAIAGLEDAKVSFRRLMRAPSAAIVYGLVGCGMKLLTRAAAAEFGSVLFPVFPVRIAAPKLGETAKNIKTLFEEIEQYDRPVLFFDEFETLGTGRETISILETFFAELERALSRPTGPVVLVGTHYPELLDPLVLERIPIRIYTGLPDLSARRTIFEKRLSILPGGSELPFEYFAKITGGQYLTCAAISRICKKIIAKFDELAGSDQNANEQLVLKMNERNIQKVTEQDVVAVIQSELAKVPVSFLLERLAAYHDWDPSTFEDFEYEPWPDRDSTFN